MTGRGWPVPRVLPGVKGTTAAGFLTRAAAHFAAAGIPAIERVMTDNALAYRNRVAFRAAICTRRPAEIQPPSRPWLESYNTQRPDAVIKGQPRASQLSPS
jgi:hypothetical protein